MISETSPLGASIPKDKSVLALLGNVQDEDTIDGLNARNSFNGGQIPYFGGVSIARHAYAARGLDGRKHLFFSPKWPHFQGIP